MLLVVCSSVCSLLMLLWLVCSWWNRIWLMLWLVWSSWVCNCWLLMRRLLILVVVVVGRLRLERVLRRLLLRRVCKMRRLLMLLLLEMGLCRWLGIVMRWRRLMGILLLLHIEVRYSLSGIDTHIGLIHRIISTMG